MRVLVAVVWLLGTAVSQQSTPLSTGNVDEALMTGDTQCPPLQSMDRASNSCRCVGDNLVVNCIDDPYHLSVQECYCMTSRQHQLLVGSCIYTCHRAVDGYFVNITADSVSQINKEVCGPFKREGQMCGRCLPGHAPPVYSYSPHCVRCTTSNWAKYLAVSLLPSTVFFVFVLLFSISATSPSLSGFILFNQIVTCASIMRNLVIEMENRNNFTPASRLVTQVFISLSGVWNLDFFRLVYTPFCLQPNTNDFQVMAMDYLTAVYPLLLIVLVYLLVLLYDRNASLIVWLCRPVVSLFIRFRRQWNIRHSLVDAFATFLLLSYVKILSVSVDILLPTLFYAPQHRHPQPIFAPFFKGDVAYFCSQHLPYACLALFFLLTFTLLPMLLLFLYPCSCFQVCLNRTGLSCQTLHTFMDSFQGHYKNGTEGTRDLRFFSGVYLLIRGLFYTSTALAYQISSYGYTTIFLIGFTATVAFVRPFKKLKYNFSDVFFLTIITILFVSLLTFTFTHTLITEKGLMPASFIFILAAMVYTIAVLCHWILTSRLVLHCWYTVRQKVQHLQFVGRHGYKSLLSP